MLLLYNKKMLVIYEISSELPLQTRVHIFVSDVIKVPTTARV